MGKKSGRASCCAPGGAWYKNCGAAGNSNVDHMWFEGVRACKAITAETISSACPKCGTTEKSGKASCCGRGGSWYRNCGSAGNAKLDHTWHEGIKVCKARAQSKRAIGQQLNSAQRKMTISSHDSVIANSKAIVMVVNKLGFTSMTTSAHTPTTDSSPKMFITSQSHTSVSTSISISGCKKMLIMFFTSYLCFIECFLLLLRLVV